MDGSKLRKLRKLKDMTIEVLSEKSGFTPSYISQVERNLIEPSLTALIKICKVLNVAPYYFLDDNNNVIVTRKEERQRLIIPDSNQELEYLVPVSEEYKNKVKMCIYKYELYPGMWDNDNFSIIDSDKCVIILKGKLIVNFTDYNEIIDEGDTIYICSNVPHKLFNPSDEKTELICIISTVTN
ncbi:MAG: Cupin 2 conserved barrel domain protein [Sedimentibacter sp.]|jgi:transcriptional regulator with XRE-family HTH domain|nr:Cupin 2 conserved barrel domain protein [Sedimentibacter sp.]